MTQQQKVQSVVQSKLFRYTFTVLGILFVILSYFITVTPDAFLHFGYFGIFTFNVISSGLLIMPVLTEKFNLFMVIFFSALGNIPNTSVNYFLGMSSSGLFSKVQLITKMKEFMKRFGLFAVYVLAVVPLPIDLNGLLSGYLGIPYKKYIAVNFLGKLTIFLIAGLGIITLSETLQK